MDSVRFIRTSQSFAMDCGLSVLLAEARPMVFVRFIRYSISPCSCSVGAPSYTGPHTLRPWGKLVFRWFYKDSLTESPVPGWGVQQQDCFRSEAPLRVLLVVRMGFDGFWITVFGLGGRVFLATVIRHMVLQT